MTEHQTPQQIGDEPSLRHTVFFYIITFVILFVMLLFWIYNKNLDGLPPQVN